MPAEIAAIVCTRNRADYLRKTLRALRGQTLAPERFEIIVVDNGSTDATREAVHEELGESPSFRYFREDELGLSIARNTGLRATSAELVAFVDDDAVPGPAWLEKLVDAFATADPPPACVGGRIDPIWESAAPAWLDRSLFPVLTMLDLGDRPFVLGPNQFVWGANMAFRRRLLEEVGAFPVELGRRGNLLLGNEDTVVQTSLKAAGHACYYAPDAAVAHHVHPHRLTKRWFRRRFFHHGASIALEQMLASRLDRAGRASVARKLLSGLLRASGSILVSLSPTRSAATFAKQCRLLAQVGYAATWIRAELRPFRRPEPRAAALASRSAGADQPTLSSPP